MMTDPVALESRSSSSPVQLAAAALMFVVVAWSARFPLAEENQMMLSGGILVVLFLLGWTERRLGEFNRVAVIVLGAYLSLRYWMFRTTETLSFTDVWDFIFLMLLYLAETYGIFTHLVGLFVNVAPMRRQSPPLPADSRVWPSVDVLIPTYNEPVDMVALTLTACTQLNYPKDKLNVFVLDDGGTEQKQQDADQARAAAARQRAQELKATAASLGVHYLTRDNVHARRQHQRRWARPSPISRPNRPPPSGPRRTSAQRRPCSHFRLRPCADEGFSPEHGGLFHRRRETCLRADPPFFHQPDTG
jgi:cellulose synthase (UDP-forming)